MTVLTFPTNPTLGQRYNAPNQIQYVYDGVKWIVETVTSTSIAVTNSVQDRVAPMFVDGDNQGITFTYNAATNALSASVTAVNGNQLVNGVHELTLESNGNITAPAFTIPNAVGTNGQVLKWPNSGSTLVWAADSSTTNKLVNGVYELVLGTDGKLTLPGGAGLQSVGVTGADGRQSLASTRTDGSLFLTANSTTAGDVYLMGQQNYIISASNISNGATYKTWTFAQSGNITLPAGGDILDSTGTSVLGGNAGLVIGDFGSGFTNTLDAGKITTSKLYNKNPNQGLNNQYELSVDDGGVVHLPDQSIINGATLKTVAGNYAGITAGPASPAGKDEDSWVWVDNDGATIATKYSTTAHTWKFDNNGKLTLPTNGTISFGTDNGDNWNAPLVNTVQAALNELALRLKAVENVEIEGGNAYTLAGPELILDGNGA
jgi:hypothetical protein